MKRPHPTSAAERLKPAAAAGSSSDETEPSRRAAPQAPKPQEPKDARTAPAPAQVAAAPPSEPSPAARPAPSAPQLPAQAKPKAKPKAAAAAGGAAGDPSERIGPTDGRPQGDFWTAVEDAKLRRLVAQTGTGDWDDKARREALHTRALSP